MGHRKKREIKDHTFFIIIFFNSHGGERDKRHVAALKQSNGNSRLSLRDSHTPPETVCPLLWLCTLWLLPSFHQKENPYLASWEEKQLRRQCSVFLWWECLKLKWRQTCQRTLPWFQCSFPRAQSTPPTCHRGIQCTACKTWHSHSSPDPADSILQRENNQNVLSIHDQTWLVNVSAA